MKIRKYFVGILAMLGMLSIGFYNSNVITTVFAAEGSSVANTEVNNELELQEAINASVAGQRITLLQNVELTSTLKVASDKDIILDLSGFTISQEYACSSSYSMIKNEGKLTIDGDGLISFKDIGAGDPTYGWGSYTIINSGELTVNSGTIENLSDHNSQGSVVHMYCAIQQGGSNNALTTIEGGKISTPSYRSIRINNGSLVINDGVMEGQIWMQPFAENTSIEINGGEFAPCGVDGSSVFVANSEKTVSLEVTGGEFATKIGASNPTALVGSVTGGTFTEAAVNGMNSALFSEDFVLVEDENGSYGVLEAVAEIDGTKYASLQSAIDAAQVNETVTLSRNVELNEILVINKSITLDGNGYTLTSTAARAINVSGGVNATIKNLTIDASGERAINVIQGASNVTIANVKATARNYTVNVASSAGESIVTIENSNLTGLNVVNVAAAQAEVTVKDSVINCMDATSQESYAAVALNKDAEYGKITVTGTTFNIQDDSLKALVVAPNGEITIDGLTDEVSIHEAIINYGNYCASFETVAEAFEAAVDGDEVEIYVAGTYALSTSGKNITITGAVDGVVFDNIGAKNMGGADVTFNNVTFDYYPNKNYTGLQHSGNLTYNNCTFEGQVFLYGVSETFNECTFNQNSKDAYNVWTYGADAVEFNKCTFNSAGKSVLVYTESETQFTDLAVENTTFNASEVVDGKAAIEIDTSLSSGANIEIDANTTATGFGSGNVSGNSLWNNKKGNNTDANNDITIKVGDVEVLAPVVFVAKISEIGYTSLADAFAAAVDGNEIILHEDVELADRIDVNAAVFLNLNGHKITSTDKNVFNVYADFTVENGTIENTSALGRCVNIRSNVNVVLNDVNLVANKSYNTQPLTIGGSTNGTKVAISDSTIDSGASGYAIIVFVQSNIVVEKSTVSGYSVLYVKEGSNGSVIEVVESTLNTKNIYSAETNIFGAIVLEDNISITVDNRSNIHVTTTGNQAQYVILSNNSKINESTYVDIQATINLTGDYARIYGLNPAITSALFANNASNIEVLRNEGVLTVETPDGLLVSWSSFVEEYINEFKTAFDAIDKSVYEPKDALELYDIKLAVIESIKAVENNNFLEVEMLVEYGIAALDEVQTKAEKEAAQELEDAKFVACFEIEDSVHVNKAVYAERIKAAKTLQEVEDILEEMKAADVHTSVVDAAVEATCTATGLTEGSHCSVCGEILVAQQEVAKKEHTVVVDAAVEATCTATGLTEGSHCSVCGEILVAQQVLPVLGHEYKLIDVVRETCTTEGSFTYVCAHDSAHTYKVVIAATGHVEVIDAAVEATCTATGLTEGSHCSVCGEILVAQQEVAKKEHTVVVDTAVAPTCESTGLTEGSHCSVCNEVLVAQQVLPVLGHNYQQTQIVEATCKEEGHIDYECVTCGDKYSTKIDKASHKYTSVVVSATCTEKGYTIFTCECGDSYVSNEVEALGHNIVDSTIAATCTENGYDVHKCTRCNYELIDNYTNPTGHTFGEWKVVTPANGYEQGLEERECSVCKVVESRNIIDSAFMQLEDAKEAAIVEVKIYAVQQNVDFASHESELIAGINSVDDIANIEKAIKDAKALVDAYVTESFNKSLETEKNNASEAIGNLSSDLDYSQYLSNISSATSLEEVRKQVELAEEASEMYEELNAWFNDYIDALIEDVEAGRIKFSNKAATARDEIVAKLNKTGLSQEDCAEILKLYDEMVAELQNPNSDKNLDELKNNFQASVEDLVNAKASDVSLTPVYIWLAIITLLIIALGLLVIITSRKNKKEANAILTQEVVEQAPVVEETKEEIVEVQEEVQPQEELSQQEEIEEESEFNFESIEARPYKPFVNRLVDANEQTQEFYNAIKNELLSYKKIRSRISKKYETFRFGRSLMVKLSITGQTLKLFLALDPNEFERNTYFHKDMSHKKAYQETPLFIRLKSRRSIKRAKELIKIMMEKSNVVVNPKYKEKDYKNELINLVNSILEEHQTN